MYVVQYDGYSYDPNGRDSGYAEIQYVVVDTLLKAAGYSGEPGRKLYECKEVPFGVAIEAQASQQGKEYIADDDVAMCRDHWVAQGSDPCTLEPISSIPEEPKPSLPSAGGVLLGAVICVATCLAMITAISFLVCYWMKP